MLEICIDKHYTYFNFFKRPIFVLFLYFYIVVTGTYFKKIVFILYTVKFNCFRKATWDFIITLYALLFDVFDVVCNTVWKLETVMFKNGVLVKH